MRLLKIAPGEHYHIFNRANAKQTIFHNFNDYARFLFLILYLQGPTKIAHIIRKIKDFTDYCHHGAQSGQSRALTTESKHGIEIVSFCIMPNHFHLIIKELDEGGIATYMHRVLTAYAKYYNTKYQKTGHVFQGPYRAVHVENNEQLLHLSAYIHRNPREIQDWFDKEIEYQWSSYQDFVGENRWDKLLVPDIILGQFENSDNYHRFVETSPAKILEQSGRDW